VLLATHVSTHALGRVLVAPVDVVLDEKSALVVQPDIVFVARDRLGIIRNQIWGAPDLVVEVLSTGTCHRDRTNKRRWYHQYGVREYWIVDPWCRSVTVLAFGGPRRNRRRVAGGNSRVRSRVLPEFDSTAAAFFELG
jgi:Uma2 family endonuclease